MSMKTKIIMAFVCVVGWVIFQVGTIIQMRLESSRIDRSTDDTERRMVQYRREMRELENAGRVFYTTNPPTITWTTADGKEAIGEIFGNAYAPHARAAMLAQGWSIQIWTNSSGRLQEMLWPPKGKGPFDWISN